MLRFVIGLRDLDIVDRLFVPDDTYYTLSIARSLARGIGPSVDGVTLTNGFQPLIAFFLTPFFWLSDDPDVPIRAAVLGMAVCDAVLVFLLGRLAFRMAGPVAAVVAALSWSVSPIAVANALGGLETSLGAMLQVALVLAALRARDVDGWKPLVLTGALAGLALLARVDSVFLVGLLAVFEMARSGLRRVGIVAAVALVVVAPWWSYSTLVFGTPVPQSGAAVRELVAQHQALYLSVPKQLGWAAGTLIGAPFVDGAFLRDVFFASPALAIPAWLLCFGAFAGAGVLLARRGFGPAAALSLHGAAILAFYSLVVPALWFFRRYLAPSEVVVTLLVAWACAAVWARRESLRLLARGGAAMLAGLTLLATAWTVSFAVMDPDTTPDVGLHGAKGYREAVRDVLSILPKDAVVGAFQSGALAYFADGSPRILNLDGVVDSGAGEAMRERKLAEYAHGRGVTHVADWPFNLRNFQLASPDGQVPREALSVLGEARPQGTDRFLVVRVNWRRTTLGPLDAGKATASTAD